MKASDTKKRKKAVRLQTLRGIGTNHLIMQSRIDPSEWIYTVTIQNLTNDVFDEIALFYQRHDMATGVIPLFGFNIKPGDVHVFRLGICKHMKHYTFGLFIGEDMVGRVPPQGQNMTLQLASPLNADSWRIEP